MASAEECREALQTLTTRLAEMSPQDRASYFGKRSMSCHVTDLGVTFITRFTDTGAEPVKEAAPDEPPADIRLTANQRRRGLAVRDPGQHRPHVALRPGQGPGQHAGPAGAPPPFVTGRPSRAAVDRVT
jgi:hypothetical protein